MKWRKLSQLAKTVRSKNAGVDKITFESGRPVKEGEVLVELDTKQEKAQLVAAEAQLELTRVNLARTKGLLDKGVASKAEFDKAAAEEKQADAKVGEVRATISRKTIRAPFSGVLGIRQVNLGEYLAERRTRKPVCENCPHACFCGGFYELDDVPEPPWLIAPEDLVRPIDDPRRHESVPAGFRGRVAARLADEG